MQRLPTLRRKGNYLTEIEAARKRPRISFEEGKDFDREVDYDYEVNESTSQYAYVDAPSTSKLPTRRYRTVPRKSLYHEPDYYRAPPSQVKLEIPQVWPILSTSRPAAAVNVFTPNYYNQPNNRMALPAPMEYIVYDEIDDLRSTDYFNATEEIEGPVPGYDYLDLQNGEVQEQVEVVDDQIGLVDHALGEEEEDIGPLTTHHHYPNQFKFPGAGPIDLFKLFEVMALQNQKNHSNDALMNFFLSDPAMANPLNVNNLIDAARNASPESNAQIIASLSMQVNYLKKELIKVKQDLTDLRAVCLARESPVISSGRKFEPLAEVSQNWNIPAIAPLNEVNLVALARVLGNYQSGKNSLRNEDLIRRYVRSVLEKLIPRHLVADFTVRDKGRGRSGHPRDVGEFSKNQITGIVLDLMGLHELNELDNRARTERAHYFQLTNRLMKCAIYDMRRIAPKKRNYN